MNAFDSKKPQKPLRRFLISGEQFRPLPTPALEVLVDLVLQVVTIPHA